MSLYNARVTFLERTKEKKRGTPQVRSDCLEVRRAKPKALGWLSQAAASGTHVACVLAYGPVGSRASSFGLTLSSPRTSCRAQYPRTAPAPFYSPPRRAAPTRAAASVFVRPSRRRVALSPFRLIHRTPQSSHPLSLPRPSPLSFCFTSKTPVLHICFFRICDDRANFRPMHGHASANSRDHDR